MTDKIGPLNHLLDVVRSAAARGRADAAGGKGAARPVLEQPGTPPTTAAAARDVEDLKARLRREVRGVDPKDPDAVKRARRGMVREITLWEFGPALRVLPEFDAMLESIDTAMAGNTRLQARFAELIVELQRGSD